MPGPFPGMDPYLESPYRWPDFHHRFVTHLAEAIGPKVQPRYLAMIGEHVFVVDPPDRQTYLPDVTIVHRNEAPSTASSVLVAPVADVPIVVSRYSDPIRQGYIKLTSRETGEVVTVIELVSPTNKAPGDGRSQYLKKQQDVLGSSTSLVEIDLLSRGTPVIDLSLGERQSLPDHRYLIGVYRASQRQQVEVYCVALSRPLPVVRIPLLESDRDIAVELQPIVDRCYDSAGYTYLLDYERPPDALLNAEEQFWLNAVLSEKGIRSGGSTGPE